jgi:hypothetical protein
VLISVKTDSDKSVLADGNDRIQGVGAGTQGAALVGSNIEHSVNLLKNAFYRVLGDETNQNE